MENQLTPNRHDDRENSVVPLNFQSPTAASIIIIITIIITFEYEEKRIRDVSNMNEH